MSHSCPHRSVIVAGCGAGPEDNGGLRLPLLLQLFLSLLSGSDLLLDHGQSFLLFRAQAEWALSRRFHLGASRRCCCAAELSCLRVFTEVAELRLLWARRRWGAVDGGRPGDVSWNRSGCRIWSRGSERPRVGRLDFDPWASVSGPLWWGNGLRRRRRRSLELGKSG